MQPPQAPRPSGGGKAGYIIVLISSALAAIAFLALPALSLTTSYNSYQGSNSASLLQIAQAMGSNGAILGSPLNASGSSVSLLSSAGIIIWMLLIFAIVSFVISFIFIIIPPSRGAGAGISFIIMSTMAVTLLGLLMLIIGAAAVGGTRLAIGIGGWLCFLGMLATLIGGIIVIVTRHTISVANAYGNLPLYPLQPFSGYPQYPPQPFSSPNYPHYSPQSSSAPNYPQYPPRPTSSPNYPPQPQQLSEP